VLVVALGVLVLASVLAALVLEDFHNHYTLHT